MPHPLPLILNPQPPWIYTSFAHFTTDSIRFIGCYVLCSYLGVSPPNENYPFLSEKLPSIYLLENGMNIVWLKYKSGLEILGKHQNLENHDYSISFIKYFTTILQFANKMNLVWICISKLTVNTNLNIQRFFSEFSFEKIM